MCPKCKEALIVVEFEGVELDYCTVCGGAWFDTGELALVVQMAGADTARLDEVLKAAGQRGDRRCPRCRAKMDIVKIGPPPEVAIDRCPHGEGLWLDAGELAAIVKAHSAQEDAVIAEFLGELFHHELTGETEES